MGLYFEWGIEYSIKLTNGTIIVIVPIRQADCRLLDSKYYQTRKEYYDENRGKLSWHEKAIDCDCKLTPEEQNKLNEILILHDKNILEHGWYDAKYHSCTL